MAPMLQMSLGLEDLTLVNAMNSYGSTAGDDAAVRGARDRRGPGERRRVRLRRRAAARGRLGVGRAGYSGRHVAATGLGGLPLAYGAYGPANTGYALALRRHMHLRHDARPARRDRRRPARVGADEPAVRR